MHSPSLLQNSQLLLNTKNMERTSNLAWLAELKLPEMLDSETVKSLHAIIDNKWGPVHRSACQTAAGRALWNHVIHDPLAGALAGESYLKSLYEKMRKDWLHNSREVSGVILAIRTLWFDAKLEAAINSFDSIDDGGAQVVLLGAGMDARAYRLSCLKECAVFEVDFKDLLEVKASLIQEAMGSSEHQQKSMTAKSLIRVAADIRDNDWIEKLRRSGFVPDKKTVWMLEGDPDANFGLLHDPQNLFTKLRNLPRSIQTHPEDGAPCRRLYLVEASGSPERAT
ncbi:uncharacterized protein LOC109850362 isoform X2 [Asparagus officinalis]|uniref:uncharacterized protein LOC109850362 isoform X2 n=1 Tax=Asparagus officinalis TaxID=4686 RepID=UPI00098E4182|nr:uncharacterized protein LOC109850362 isoform X2 [Asparagus officinalis]